MRARVWAALLLLCSCYRFWFLVFIVVVVFILFFWYCFIHSDSDWFYNFGISHALNFKFICPFYVFSFILFAHLLCVSKSVYAFVSVLFAFIVFLCHKHLHINALAHTLYDVASLSYLVSVSFCLVLDILFHTFFLFSLSDVWCFYLPMVMGLCSI